MRVSLTNAQPRDGARHLKSYSYAGMCKGDVLVMGFSLPLNSKNGWSPFLK
jgi:hypothetical protein